MTFLFFQKPGFLPIFLPIILNSPISPPPPPFRSDIVCRPGGGVAIYVRDGITAIERPDLSVNGVEAIWVDIKINRKTLLVGGFYRPPNSNNNHWNLIEHSIDQAFNQAALLLVISI